MLYRRLTNNQHYKQQLFQDLSQINLTLTNFDQVLNQIMNMQQDKVVQPNMYLYIRYLLLQMLRIKRLIHQHNQHILLQIRNYLLYILQPQKQLQLNNFQLNYQNYMVHINLQIRNYHLYIAMIMGQYIHLQQCRQNTRYIVNYIMYIQLYMMQQY